VVGLSGLCFIGRRRSRCSGFVPVRQGVPLVLVTLSWSCSVCSSCEGRRSLRSPERATSVPSDPGWREPPSSAGLRECAARIAAELVGRLQPASANAMSAGWSGGFPRRFGRVTIGRQRRPTRQGATRGPRRRDCMIRCPGTALSRFVGRAMRLWRSESEPERPGSNFENRQAKSEEKSFAADSEKLFPSDLPETASSQSN
jgi:hypothetical protein